MSEDPKTTVTAAAKSVAEAPDTLPDYYANIIKAHFTPFEINVAFGRVMIPFESPEDKTVDLLKHIVPVVRVGLPLATLPSFVGLLQLQLAKARERGLLPSEEQEKALKASMEKPHGE